MFHSSSSNGVKSLSVKKFKKKYKLVNFFTCNKKINLYDFLFWFHKHRNKKYSTAQLGGLFIKTYTMVKNNPFGRGAKRIICNELVILFLNRFYNTKIVDTDGLDLNDTEDILLKLKL